MCFRLFVAIAVLSCSVAAYADTISTYEVQSQTGNMNLGSVTIDSSSGVIQNIDLVVTIGSTSIPFDAMPVTQAFSPRTNEFVATVLGMGDALQFNLAVPSLVDYRPMDRARCRTQAEYCDYLANVYVGAVSGADLQDTLEGNLVAATPASITPEPGSIALLGTGLLGMGGLMRRRMLEGPRPASYQK